ANTLGLDADRTELIGLADAIPARGRLCWLPSQLADRWRAEWNPTKYSNAVRRIRGCRDQPCVRANRLRCRGWKNGDTNRQDRRRKDHSCHPTLGHRPPDQPPLKLRRSAIALAKAEGRTLHAL